MKNIICMAVFSLLAGVAMPAFAQNTITLGGQIRTRGEMRYGQGSLPEKNSVPAFFISQRSRLNAGFNNPWFKLYLSVQDVRLWGQDASSINRLTTQGMNGFMLHEAWAELIIANGDTTRKIKVENLSFKLGRMELIYNDHRLLGNLDWLQQARRHDMALFKFAHKGWTLHIGAAFNQNKENKSSTIYTGVPDATAGYTAGTNGIGVMYKSMQFLYLNKKFKPGNVNLLFIKDDFSKYKINGTVKEYNRATWGRYTVGLHTDLVFKEKYSLTAEFYYQTGKNKDGANITNAFMANVFANIQIHKKFGFGPGFDYMSGDNSVKQTANQTTAFDPLYGTPHKFWGYMDYFYVADAYVVAGRNPGLMDGYLRFKALPHEKITLALDGHAFLASNKIANLSTTDANDALSPYLGTELDLVMNWVPAKMVNVELGGSVMLGSNSMDKTKLPAADKQKMGYWAYLMVSFKPDFTINIDKKDKDAK